MLRQLMLLLGAAVSSFFWTSMSILIAFVLFEIQLKLSAEKIKVKSLFSFLSTSQGKIAILSIFYSLTCELLVIILLLMILRYLGVFRQRWFSGLDVFSLVSVLVLDLAILVCYILDIKFSYPIIDTIFLFIWGVKLIQDYQRFRMIHEHERLTERLTGGAGL